MHHFLGSKISNSHEMISSSKSQHTLYIETKEALMPHDDNVNDWLKRWALQAPDRIFLAERNQQNDWAKISYGEMLNSVLRVASALIVNGAKPEHKLIAFSRNSIRHAIMQMACTAIGLIYVPVAPIFGRSEHFKSKISSLIELVNPTWVYAESIYSVLSDINNKALHFITDSQSPPEFKAYQLDAWLNHDISTALVEYEAKITPETWVKILFTSGSTGMPKGVPNSHSMICANQQALVQIWPFLLSSPPVIVDWLPWHHTFGGNHNFYMILRNGGTLYIDHGQPTASEFDISLQNLKQINPTIYLNVPQGHSQLLPYIEQDKAFADHFFKKLKVIFSAASSLSADLWLRWKRLCESYESQACLLSGWGCTETSPLATNTNFLSLSSGNIGLPVPGCKLKLRATKLGYQVGVKGPNVFKGYIGDSKKPYFDEEGYFDTGDLVSFLDPEKFGGGLKFEGRRGENFKLSSGSWVHVQKIRMELIYQLPQIIQDVAVIGVSQDNVGILIIPNMTSCQNIMKCPTATLESISQSSEIQDQILLTIHLLNKKNKGISRQIRHLAFAIPPLDINTNEITAKGYINQGAVSKNRKDFINRLYQQNQFTFPEIFFYD